MNLPSYIQKHLDLSTFKWNRLLLVLVILFVGMVLRFHGLEDIFLWNDETDWFDEEVYGHKSLGLLRYAALKAQEHSVGPAWPIIVRLACKALGGTAMVARIPSVLFGTATILAILFLVYYVLKSHSRKSAFVAAFLAALLTAISIPQIEFSQRTYPFGTIPFLTTLLVLLHLEIVKVIQSDRLSIEKFSILAFLYALIAGFSIFLHMSFSIVLVSSFFILLVLARRFLKLDHQNQVTFIGISALAVLSVFLAWIGNEIHISPNQTGYRPYLASYYHRLDSGAIFFLLTRVYDVMTYHLNLFYNGALYWPRQLNPVLLPLVGFCIFGWIYAAFGKFGQVAKHLSILAIMCLILIAVLSFLKKYPFGGVRQTVFMAPFLFSFTAMGFYALGRSARWKPIAVVVGVAYIILWIINLPHFYQERIIPFDSRELLTAWEQSGKPKVYTLSGCKDSIKYRMRQHSQVEVQNLPFPLPNDQVFLIVSIHGAIEDGHGLWRPRLQEEIKRSGYITTLIMKRIPKYPWKPDYRQSLYFPPNGLWVYKMSVKKTTGNVPANNF